MARDYSDTILDTIEAFLDGAPALEEDNVEGIRFSEHMTGEAPTVRMMNVMIGGQTYLVVAKRVGG